MKFGIREVADVVLRAKSTMTIGNTTFQPDEPVLYFDTLKASTIEGESQTTYAVGGRGASRLLTWEGEKTLTFNFEDALISPLGLSILTGAGLTEGSVGQKITMHRTAKVTAVGATGGGSLEIDLSGALSTNESLAKTDAYVFLIENDAIKEKLGKITVNDTMVTNRKITISKSNATAGQKMTVLVDFYVEVATGGYEISITPDKFGGYFYIEGSTLFRRKSDGKDVAAEFVIPKGKIQTSINIPMSPNGDPATFSFKVDAMPDYTKFDKTKKVLCAIQISDN